MKNKTLHAVWRTMKFRCYNPKSDRYYRYGGRGIKVCDEWLNMENFVQWALSNGYEKGLHIDRINNNGNYEPSNCRFVTAKINANNMHSNIKVTANGETLSVAEWSNRLGIKYSAMYARIKTYGIDPAKAVTVKEMVRGPRKGNHIICINTGKYYKNQTEAAKELNLSVSNISAVLRKKRKSTGGYMFELSA